MCGSGSFVRWDAGLADVPVLAVQVVDVEEEFAAVQRASHGDEHCATDESGQGIAGGRSGTVDGVFAAASSQGSGTAIVQGGGSGALRVWSDARAVPRQPH